MNNVEIISNEQWQHLTQSAQMHKPGEHTHHVLLNISLKGAL